LAPTCTAISGAIFLGEGFKLREATAGCRYFYYVAENLSIPYPSWPLILVVSFVGVVLIARPAALFGDHGSTAIPSDADKVAASDRVKAVV
jgi:hypothetical protein